MPFEPVLVPIPGPSSFSRSDDAAILTQAANLLVIGSQLRGDDRRLRLAAPGLPSAAETVGEEERSRLGLPPLQEVPGKTNSQQIRQLLFGRYNLPVPPRMMIPEVLVQNQDVFADVAKKHFSEPSSKTALDLLELCLAHPHELIRVSAAAAYSERSSELDRLIRILEAGTHSKEDLVRDVSATSLALTAPSHPRLKEMQSAGPGNGPAGAAGTTMLIHGTWAANSPWWQPGGDFHTYILQSVRPDLYAKPDRFGWSGGYSDAARTLAAQDLIQWVNLHKEQGLDLITHSHGGNLAMQATQMNPGLTIGELILLSCPVHIPKYLPDFSKIAKKTVSIRVHLDLVILADRGGQKFSLPQITENVLPLWFDHFATHNPNVWRKYNVPAMI